MNVDHEYNLREELGPIPEGWVAVRFASVREWLQYGTSVRCRSEPTEFPVLRIPNIELGHVNTSDLKFAELNSSEASRYRLDEGDLIFIRTNGVVERLGSCAVYGNQPENALFASYLIRARLKLERVDPHFAAYFFASQRGNRIIAGRATPAADGKFNLNTGTIDSLPFPLPPTLDEQCEIVGALASVQDAIKLHDQSLTVSRSLKSAAMRALFTKGLRGEARKHTEIGLVPESWDVEPLGKHYSAVSGGTPSRANSEFWEGGTIPWVKTTEVNYGVITSTEEHITEAGLQGSAAKWLQAGTLLMAMYGQGVTRGKVAILGIDATCNQACAALRPLDESVDSLFLFHFLSWRYDEIRQLAHGGQQQNLNLEIVRDLPIVCPPTLGEQREIVTILDAIDRKIDLHKRKRTVLDELFKALLHKLMTGEIRVADLDLSALEPAKETEAAA